LISGAVSLVFWYFLFFYQVNGDKILRLKDCYSNLPLKGFFFTGVSVLVGFLAYLLHVDKFFVNLALNSVPETLSEYWIFFVISAATSFLSEFLSNTVVQLGMFMVVIPASKTLDFSTLASMICITLSCSCAFMSPIATAVNGLAYGGIKNVSLVKMLYVGFFMNIVTALTIAFWGLYIMAPFYETTLK
jgi:sodium-dependent dicarboxylate transporter 2/3/5